MSSSERGFTLLELMTVVLLSGLLAGIGLSMDFSDSANTPEQQLQRLAQQFNLVSEEAVLSGAMLGLDFYSAGNTVGYRWLTHNGAQWLAAEPAVMNAEAGEVLLPPGQFRELSVEGQTLRPEPLQDLLTDERTQFAPEVLLLPTREFTPFTIVLGTASDGRKLQVDALGRAEVVDAPMR